MKFQFIKNCPRNNYLMNKSYRKYNIIDNCVYLPSISKDKVIHYTERSIEIIPIEYLKIYEHQNRPLKSGGDNLEQDNLFKKTEYALYNYKDLDIKIKSIDIDIELLKNDITLKAINYDEKTGPTNAFSSSVENEVIRRDEVVQQQLSKLEKDKLLYVSRKNKIENALNCLNNEELQLVKMRYFQKGKESWTKIGLTLGMDRMTCSRMRNKIIKELSNYIFN